MHIRRLCICHSLCVKQWQRCDGNRIATKWEVLINGHFFYLPFRCGFVQQCEMIICDPAEWHKHDGEESAVHSLSGFEFIVIQYESFSQCRDSSNSQQL